MLRKIVLLCLIASLQLSLQAQKAQANPVAVFNRLPVSFVENYGQVDSHVRFLAQAGNGTIYFTPTEAVLALDPSPAIDKTANSSNTKDKFQISVLRMKWMGADPNPQILAERPLPGKINYLIGRDPARWHTNLPTYAHVRYRQLYPGVDAVFYGKEGEIEYDLVVSPGTSLSKVAFALDGIKQMKVADNGDLVLGLENGGIEARQLRPVAYQQVNGARRLLAARYVIHRDKTVGFAVAGYDRKLPLVIDPTLTYSTFVSSGSNFHEIRSVAVDQSGNAYITGITSTAFPNKHPEFGSQGAENAYVTKFSPSGSSLVYSTVFGGNSADEGIAMAIDRFGNTYIAGHTFSTDFPTTPGSFEPPAGSIDADNGFITKLNSSGSAFVYSLVLGGGDSDTINALALDAQHRVYVTGFTCSTNFPVKNAFQPVTVGQNCADGGGDAFVTRVNAAGTGLDYSTYLDGTIESNGNGIAVDSTFEAYVTGSTESPDFPTTPGAFQTTLRAKPIPNFPNDIPQSNAFVTKFSADGQSLVFSTFLGGTANDVAEGIALDPDGRACVTGNASSADFPITSGAFQKTLRGSTDAFVTKFQLSGGGLFYSTYLGGSSTDGASSIAVDSFGRAYVTGSTFSTDFPVLNPIQAHLAGAQDAFVTKLSATGNALFFSTYLGGTADDVANSIRLDSSGNAYLGGTTASSDFPTTPGAFFRTKMTGTDGWLAKITP